MYSFCTALYMDNAIKICHNKNNFKKQLRIQILFKRVMIKNNNNWKHNKLNIYKIIIYQILYIRKWLPNNLAPKFQHMKIIKHKIKLYINGSACALSIRTD